MDRVEYLNICHSYFLRQLSLLLRRKAAVTTLLNISCVTYSLVLSASFSILLYRELIVVPAEGRPLTRSFSSVQYGFRGNFPKPFSPLLLCSSPAGKFYNFLKCKENILSYNKNKTLITRRKHGREKNCCSFFFLLIFQFVSVTE